MLSPFRFVGIMTAILATCGPARAQGIAPAGSGVTIDKVVIESGFVRTVKYYVTGGSPRLQALVRRVEWAENELGVIEQLQLLKLDTVVNERRVAAFRTEQLTNPYYVPGFLPFPIAADNGGDGDSYLQRALKRQLVPAATPEAAMQLIGLLERLQTDLDAELKALPPQEKKAAQGPIDALRPRLSALPRPDRSDVPQSRAQPSVPQPATLPAQAVSQAIDPVVFQQMVLRNQVMVRQQQIAQTQQQMMQGRPQIIQQHALQRMGLQR
jgi:hypothetical protein